MTRILNKRHYKAFTLIEIMVATIIAAFVALTAVAALRAVAAGREKINQNIEAAAEVRYAAGLLRQDLENLYRDRNYQNTKLVGWTEPSDYGDVTRLLFYTVNTVKARPDKPEGDVYEVEYILRREEDQTLLVRRLWPNPSEDFDPGGIATIIARHIIGFEVGYFDGTQWLTEWTRDQRTLPLLVAVTLVGRMPEQKDFIRNSFMINFSRWPAMQSMSPETNLPDNRPTNENENENNP